MLLALCLSSKRLPNGHTNCGYHLESVRLVLLCVNKPAHGIVGSDDPEVVHDSVTRRLPDRLSSLWEVWTTMISILVVRNEWCDGCAFFHIIRR